MSGLETVAEEKVTYSPNIEKVYETVTNKLSKLKKNKNIWLQLNVGFHPKQLQDIFELSQNTDEIHYFDCSYYSLGRGYYNADSSVDSKDFVIINAKNIGKVLEKNVNIEKISFSGCKITEKAARILANALAKNSSLKRINFNDCSIDDEILSIFAKIFKNNLALKYIILSKNNITIKGAKILFDTLKNHRAFHEINLYDNDLTIKQDDTNAFENIICSNKNLNRFCLDYDKNMFVDLFMTSEIVINTLHDINNLKKILEKNPAIYKITLQDVGMKELTQFAEFLKTDKIITHLSLRDCKIGDEGMRVLAEGLKENSTIAILDLAGNNIGDAGARYFAEIIRKDMYLINLENNDITDVGVDIIYHSMKKKGLYSYYTGMSHYINIRLENNNIVRNEIFKNIDNETKESFFRDIWQKTENLFSLYGYSSQYKETGKKFISMQHSRIIIDEINKRMNSSGYDDTIYFMGDRQINSAFLSYYYPLKIHLQNTLDKVIAYSKMNESDKSKSYQHLGLFVSMHREMSALELLAHGMNIDGGMDLDLKGIYFDVKRRAINTIMRDYPPEFRALPMDIIEHIISFARNSNKTQDDPLVKIVEAKISKCTQNATVTEKQRKIYAEKAKTNMFNAVLIGGLSAISAESFIVCANKNLRNFFAKLLGKTLGKHVIPLFSSLSAISGVGAATTVMIHCFSNKENKAVDDTNKIRSAII